MLQPLRNFGRGRDEVEVSSAGAALARVQRWRRLHLHFTADRWVQLRVEAHSTHAAAAAAAAAGSAANCRRRVKVVALQRFVAQFGFEYSGFRNPFYLSTRMAHSSE